MYTSAIYVSYIYDIAGPKSSGFGRHRLQDSPANLKAMPAEEAIQNPWIWRENQRGVLIGFCVYCVDTYVVV